MTETTLDSTTRSKLDIAIELLDVAISDETPFYTRREYAGKARYILLRLRDKLQDEGETMCTGVSQGLPERRKKENVK